MFKAIKEFFFGKPTTAPQPVAPYKVEAPVATVEVAPALAPIVEAKPELKVVQGNADAKPKRAPAKKTTAKPKAAAKPAAKTAPKKSRASKATK